MKIEFFLPTLEEWCGTYEGGYVQVYITNDKQPINITKNHCDWKHFIFIIFSGNDDLMWAKRYEIEDSQKDIELLKAFELVSKIPTPIMKEDLIKLGFESE
jgi:hypothetical protein